MVQSRAVTAEEYLQELPEEHRAVLVAVREVVLRNLPEGYVESVSWGMLSYEIPLERYPDTYNGRPLGYAALAAQKNYYALYLMGADAEQAAWLKDEFRKAGKKLDMGKSCLRFRSLEDLPLQVIAGAIASTPPDEFIARYEASRTR